MNKNHELDFKLKLINEYKEEKLASENQIYFFLGFPTKNKATKTTNIAISIEKIILPNKPLGIDQKKLTVEKTNIAINPNFNA
ncbi:hypothetical protein [Staphylococcus felis]|uniref:Uncharacterized protein n=1 Tax=Staphylococcus felis TaxID=46127 RepID=A0ABS0QM19_9STAP|nr:hypothetical protein [Staphylococcus felis]MBH9580181.1 hypothetical protein [Staphylococcus felis]